MVSLVRGDASEATVGLEATKIYGICGGHEDVRGWDLGDAGCCEEGETGLA